MGIQVRGANNSLTTHILYTQGITLDDVEQDLNNLRQAVSQAEATLQNLTQAVTNGQAKALAQTNAIQATLQNLTRDLDALDDRAATIQAAATESNQLVRNIEMPNLEPIQDQLDESQSESERLRSHLIGITVLAIFTLMGVLGALLHTAWPHMRHWLPPRDAPDDQEDDLDQILQQEQAEAEALAVELVPDAPGVAGHLETELRDKLTPSEEE